MHRRNPFAKKEVGAGGELKRMGKDYISFGPRYKSYGLWKSYGKSTHFYSTVKVNDFEAISSYSPLVWIGWILVKSTLIIDREREMIRVSRKCKSEAAI